MQTMHSRCLIVSLLLAAAALGGCGHDAGDPMSAAAASSTPATDDAQATPAGGSPASTAHADPQLTPLTPADIDLYLVVMRAAAARVRHPSAQDLDALRQQQAYESQAEADSRADAPAMAAMDARQKAVQAALDDAMQSGDYSKVRALAAEQVKATGKAAASLELATPPDDATTARATHLRDGQADLQIVDERHLDADRYQRIVDVIEEALPPPGAFFGDCGGCQGKPDAAELQREKAHAAGLARNRETLAPNAAEIRALQAVVRVHRP